MDYNQTYIEQNIPWYQGQQVFESAYHNPWFFPEDEKLEVTLYKLT